MNSRRGGFNASSAGRRHDLWPVARLATQSLRRDLRNNHHCEVHMVRYMENRDSAEISASVLEALDAGDVVAIVADGETRALVLPVRGGDVEAALDSVDRMRALRALERIQAESVRRGLDKMTLEEINAEIAAARAERKARRGE